jgi:hypothetical protein
LVEQPAVLPVLDRIHPHENAIEGQQLLPNLVDRVIAVGDLFNDHGQPVERGIQRPEAPVRARRWRLSPPVTPPQHPDARQLLTSFSHVACLLIPPIPITVNRNRSEVRMRRR